MIVDTSALVAIVKGEAGPTELVKAILATSARVSAASYVELMCVLARIGEPAAARRADRLLEALGIEIVDVSVGQARVAAAAYQVYGRGTGHRAALDFGDTFSYALAVARDEPLLFVGDGFRHTNVTVVDARH